MHASLNLGQAFRETADHSMPDVVGVIVLWLLFMVVCVLGGLHRPALFMALTFAPSVLP